MATLDERGHEVLDDTPAVLPVRFKRVENLASEVARLVEHAISQRADAQGFETFEEANDFDCGEGKNEFYSPHEEVEDHERQYFEDRAAYYDQRRAGGKKGSANEGSGKDEGPIRSDRKTDEGSGKGSQSDKPGVGGDEPIDKK